MGQLTSMRRRWLRVILSAEADLVADQAEQGLILLRRSGKSSALP